MATQTYVDSTTLTAAAEFNKFDTAAYVALSGVAGTNTITATGPANLGLVATNPPLWFIPAVTNTGATTLAITPSGGAALTAKNVFSGGVACAGGELVAGIPVAVVYDGTQYQILSAPASKGTFTASLTGCTTVPTVTASYSVTNGVVTVFYPLVTATSNTTAMTITGQPAAIRPVTARPNWFANVQDNSAAGFAGRVDIGTDGVLTFYTTSTGTGFTASGTKGISGGITLTYNLT